MILLQSFNTDADLVTHSAVPVTTNLITVQPYNTSAIRAIVLARGLTDGASGMWELRWCVKRDSGNLSLISAAVNLFTPHLDLGAATWAAAAVASGIQVGLTVTGAALQDVGWWWLIDVFGFSTINPAGQG